MTEIKKPKKLLECKFCGRDDFKKRNSLTNHEKFCPSNPDSPAFQKKKETLEKAKQDVTEVKNQIPQPQPEQIRYPPVSNPPELNPKIQQIEENINPILQQQNLAETKEEDIAELKRDNRLKKERINEENYNKQLNNLYGEQNPLDVLAKTLSIQNMAKLGQGNNDQTQTLLALQSQNYQSQMAMQQQMFALQQKMNDNQFAYMKQQLEEKKREGSAINEIEKMEKLMTKLGYEKSEGGNSAMMETIGKALEVGAPLLQKLGEKKYGLPSNNNPIPAPVITEEMQLGGGEITPLQSPQAIGGENPPVLQRTIAPPYFSDEQIEAYAKKNYITEPETYNSYTDYKNYVPQPEKNG